MAELMNWPPSRGPNPYARRITYRQGAVTREDVPMEPTPVSEAERAIIESAGGMVSEGAEFPTVPTVPKAERAPVVGSWTVWFQVEDVASLDLQQAVRILRGVKEGSDERWASDDWYNEKFGALETLIDYPLSMAVRLRVEPMTVTWTGGMRPEETSLEMRLGYFLWVVAQEYVRIYEEAEKYGIWGHAMSDLGFERIVVRADGTVDLYIGS